MSKGETGQRPADEAEVAPDDVSTLLEATSEILSGRSFPETARALFDRAKSVTGARSGYVALLSDTGEGNEVLFLDAGGLECTVNPELPMPIRGLRAEAYTSGETVYDNEFKTSDWTKFLPAGHVPMRNVMFAPLVIEGTVAGIMGLANKDGDFTDRDAKLAGYFGSYAAIALRNARTMDTLNQAVSELEGALSHVKRLQGFLAICASCKNIRDDKGFWHDVEAYISEHSESVFTHSICEKCASTLYDEDPSKV